MATPPTNITSRDRFRRAVDCLPVDRPPAWIMRQAGRYLPEYRELRTRHPFLECVHQPELAAEITLQPLARFPLDAAILFSDILIALEAVGLEVTFGDGGPRLTQPLSDADVTRLASVDAPTVFAPVTRALALVRARLGEERALLGFAGAPFTLACYAIDGRGGGDFPVTRKLLHSAPERLEAVLDRLADVVGELLVLQVQAGCDAVQLFDTWAGLLSAEDYRRFIAPRNRRIVQQVRAAGGRCIHFVRDGGHLLDESIGAGANAVGLDWRVDARVAAAAAAGRCAIQGNIDPLTLFAPAHAIRQRVQRLHADVGGRTGHVFNLGHGIVPDTPIAGVEAFLAAVHALEPA